MIYLSINIKGLVQGVGFRYFCYKLAMKYDAKGYVKNMSDGSVYLDIEADEKVIDVFIEELRTGHRYAEVNSIKTERKKFENKYKDFRIY